jgi:hypothetical protein
MWKICIYANRLAMKNCIVPKKITVITTASFSAFEHSFSNSYILACLKSGIRFPKISELYELSCRPLLEKQKAVRN